MPVHVSSLLWRNCFALTGGISKVFKAGKEMGLVHITSCYPNFNGSHFGLPPNEIHRMTGPGSKIMWTMTYLQMPHWLSKLQVLKNVPKVKQIQMQTNGSFLYCKSGFDLTVFTVWEMSLRSSLSRCSGVKNAFFLRGEFHFRFFHLRFHLSTSLLNILCFVWCEPARLTTFLNWRHFGLHWRISLILILLESSWLQLPGDALRLLIACRAFE